VAISVKKYSEKHHEIAREGKKVMFKWEMDKRYVEAQNDQILIQCIGTMSDERARRIWAIINEKDEPVQSSAK
jgi:hypothetical protein